MKASLTGFTALGLRVRRRSDVGPGHRRRFHWFERAMGVLKIRLPDVRLLP
ncbi:MAG: hypothetical protein ABIS28_08265 [Caldimonas sp.]